MVKILCCSSCYTKFAITQLMLYSWSSFFVCFLSSSCWFGAKCFLFCVVQAMFILIVVPFLLHYCYLPLSLLFTHTLLQIQRSDKMKIKDTVQPPAVCDMTIIFDANAGAFWSDSIGGTVSNSNVQTRAGVINSSLWCHQKCAL